MMSCANPECVLPSNHDEPCRFNQPAINLDPDRLTKIEPGATYAVVLTGPLTQEQAFRARAEFRELTGAELVVLVGAVAERGVA